MDDEEFYEEVSDQEVELDQQQEVVGVAVPQPVNIPLEIQVGPADNAESPPPSPDSPSPVLGSPPQQPGDAPSFMAFFTSDDLIDLEQLAVDAQSLRGTPDLRLEEPEISPKLKTILRYTCARNGSLNLFSRRGSSLFVS